jgi:uncharacterized protein (DUF1015 family)
MVDIAPFNALRYAPKKSNDISAEICPPYDVISPAEREALAKRAPDNVVQLELPSDNGVDKYTSAANLLGAWRKKGVLADDTAPAFYLLETTYKIKDAFAPSSELKRYGVLVALKLETPGKGSIHPHEKTLPKAKEDRLNLLTAIKTNVSPIFGLFFDDKKEWPAWVKATTSAAPTVVGDEHKDLRHRLWLINDATQQKKLQALLKTKDLYIADGHHRYEVAWAYRENRLKGLPAGGLAGSPSVALAKEGWNRVMAYVCPMEEPGLLMLPTHRLIKSAKSEADWKAQLSKNFTIEPMKNWQAIVAELAGPKNGRAIGWMNSSGAFMLRLKKDVSIDSVLASRPKALRELDVVLLHDTVIGEEKEIIYTRDFSEIESTLKKDKQWNAFILRNAGVDSLARVAQAHEVMPPKTTYFYPKVPTGFTLMDLEKTI